MTAGDAEVGQQLGDLLAGHGGAAVRVDGVGHDAVAFDGLADQLLGPLGCFGAFDGVADDVAAEDVDDHVGVEPDALGRTGQPGDVPGEHLRGSVRDELGDRPGRVGGLAAAFAVLPGGGQDPVHRPLRAPVVPRVPLTCPDLGGRQVGVLRPVQQCEDRGPLGRWRGRGGRGSWGRCGPRLRAEVAVVGGA